jgi:hypothetical protein
MKVFSNRRHRLTGCKLFKGLNRLKVLHLLGRVALEDDPAILIYGLSPPLNNDCAKPVDALVLLVDNPAVPPTLNESSILCIIGR